MPAAQPRRLSRDARRRQLVAAALPLVARQGLAGLSLEDLADRAGVTRNLLYHYFPRGRVDIVVAVVEEAERQLAPTRPSNHPLAAMIDHGLAPTHAWLIHKMAAGETDPEIRATVARAAEERVETLCSGHTLSAERGPVAEASLRGYLGFTEAALDRARAVGLPRAEVMRLLDRMLAAALDAARR
jgi:AcrR family transcriptional regulator